MLALYPALHSLCPRCLLPPQRKAPGEDGKLVCVRANHPAKDGKSYMMRVGPVNQPVRDVNDPTSKVSTPQYPSDRCAS